MTYTVVLFLFTLLSFFLNELILFPFLLIFSAFGHLKLKLGIENLLYFFGILTVIGISFINNLFDFNIVLGIHILLVFLFTIFIRDRQFDINDILKIIKLFLLANVLLIVFDFNLNQLDMTFTANSIPRFRSIFLEPSVASFIFILTLLILYNYDKKVSFWIFLNLLFVLITFSGSGFAIILVLLLFSMKLKISKKSVKKMFFIGIIIMPLVFIFVKSEGFEKLVSKRIERIEKGGDNSSKLRFLAPLQVAEYTFMNSPLWGFGLGSSEKIINQNRNEFTYFKHFDGTPTVQINNAYAIIFMSGGIFLFFIHIIFIYLLYKYVDSKSIHLYIFFIIYPFFSGHYANILMWFIAYLLIHLGNSSKRNLEANKF